MPLKLPPPRGGVLRALIWLVSIVVIVGVAVAFLADRTLRHKFESPIAAFRKEVTGSVGFFCEQQTLLARDAWFHEPRTEGDAGPLLNAWMPWEPAHEPPAGSPMLLPETLLRPVGGPGDWHDSGLDVSGLDFEWMRKLHAYDRWDILLNAPKPPVDRIDWVNTPLPIFSYLQKWARFRMLHGLKTGQPLEAARDVRQLAWLAYRTETLLGGLVAVTLLRLERQAYDSLPTAPADWRPMSDEQIDSLRDILIAGSAFSNIATPPEVARQARRCGEPALTRCTALVEGGFYLKYLQPLAQEDYRNAYAAHAEDVEALPCATSLPRALWERGMTIEEQRLAKSPDSPGWLNSVPGAFMGSRVGGVLVSVGLPKLKSLRELRARVEGTPPAPAPRP